MKFNEDLLLEIRKNETISKDRLLTILSKNYSKMNNSYAYRIISELIKNNHLYKLDSDTYTTKKKKIFSYEIDDKKLVRYVKGYGDYVIWDSNILNKWVNHLLHMFITFIEVDKDLMGIVFDDLKNHGYKNILLNPNLNEFHKYMDDILIIIRPLTKSFIEQDNKISIERLIVQLYSDRILNTLYGKSDLEYMLNEIFKTYQINLNKVYHYAKRKKIYHDFHEYLIDSVDRKYIYHD